MPERPGAPHHLRVEHLDPAFGIDTPVPRLSWRLPAGAQRQLAWRIQADTGWDSGRVQSAHSVLVEYGGPPLGSRDRLSWRVVVWTEQGESEWSPWCSLELGLLEPGDWTARWIEPHEPVLAAPGQRAALLVRGVVTLDGPVPSARIYATAHGIYELFVNGRRIGDAELTPGYTQYARRLQVQAHDVGSALGTGENVVAAILSDGWFRGQVGAVRAHDQWGSRLAFLAQLELELGDGSRRTWGTDASWVSRRSEIDGADLIAGQSTDLRRRVPGWNTPDGPADGWDPVVVADGHGYTRLVASPAPPVRAVATVAPVAVWRAGAGQIVDLGQNINGWVRLHDLGPAGTRLTLTHGEALDAGGDLTTAHLDVDLPFLPAPLDAGQVDRVVSGGPGEPYEPRHTTHGFRYVRVEGHPGELTAGELTGVVVHTDMTRTGWFSCSDERINRLHEAAVWSFRDNACDVPTDCPTRERAAWTGDWQVFVPTAAFLYDVAGFTTKWLRDLAAEQWSDGTVANLAPSPPAESAGGMVAGLNGSAGWGDAAVIVPWEIYRAYGDLRLLAEQWESMVAWMSHVEATAAGARHPDRVARRPQGAEHERWLWDTGFHWGEWLVPGAELKEPEDFAALQAADHADTATAYFAHSARLMSEIATVLGRTAQAARYGALSQRVRRAWQCEFVSAGGELTPDTQANHVRALAFELIGPGLRDRVAARLVSLIEAAGMHLGTGFLATPYLLPTLAQTGHLDVAYRLLFSDTMPSWLYMIDRGATTVWERWNGIATDGTPYESLNHYSKGAVVSFLHRHVAGIQLLDGEPAYRHFRIAPAPGGAIQWARARHDCPYGTIESAWRIAGATLECELTVPPGTTAEIVLPDGPRGTVGAGTHTVCGAWG